MCDLRQLTITRPGDQRRLHGLQKRLPTLRAWASHSPSQQSDPSVLRGEDLNQRTGLTPSAAVENVDWLRVYPRGARA